MIGVQIRLRGGNAGGVPNETNDESDDGGFFDTSTDSTCNSLNGDDGGYSTANEDLPSSQLLSTIAPSGPQGVGTGFLQGYITMTTFTCWVSSFSWDSLNPVSDIGPIPDFYLKGGKADTKAARASYNPDPYVTGLSDVFAKVLNNSPRAGNPFTSGIVWPHICEISLLAGLGCGEILMHQGWEEIKKWNEARRKEERGKGDSGRKGSEVDYVVVMATDASKVGGLWESRILDIGPRPTTCHQSHMFTP